MRSALTTLAELIGIAAISVGSGLIYLPAGIICAGFCLLLLGILAA